MRRFLLPFISLAALAEAAVARDLTTTSGTTFHDVVVTGVQGTGLEFRFAGGTAFVKFSDLPANELAAFFRLGKGEADPQAPPEQPPVIVAPPGAVQVPLDDAAVAIAPPPELIFVPEIVTVDGGFFTDCFVLGIDPYGLRFRHRDGICTLPFAKLPDGLRTRYDYHRFAAGQGGAGNHSGSPPPNTVVGTIAPVRPVAVARASAPAATRNTVMGSLIPVQTGSVPTVPVATRPAPIAAAPYGGSPATVISRATAPSVSTGGLRYGGTLPGMRR